MPPKKKRIPPREEALSVGTVPEARQRLAEWVKKKFDGNWTRFAETVGVSKATAEEWKPAKKGAPGFDALLRFAEQRLSLDWLATGKGSMEWEPFVSITDSGSLLLTLRRILAQRSGVGEQQSEQAFNEMRVIHSDAKVYEYAANGVEAAYREVLRGFQAKDEAVKLDGWVLHRLVVLDKEVRAQNVEGIREVLQETRATIKASLPGWWDEARARRDLERREDEDLAQEQIRRAERNEWHAAAFSTTADVVRAVEGATERMVEISRVAAVPEARVNEQLGKIAAALQQLVAGVNAIQPKPSLLDSEAQSDEE